MKCEDTDGNDIADFQAIVTWHQNTNFTCGTNESEGEDFGPGAPPKCDWSRVSLEIDVYPFGATLTLQKEVINEGGGSAVDTDWTLTADGPDEDFSGVEGEGNP